jgi:hypothetical protein
VSARGSAYGSVYGWVGVASAAAPITVRQVGETHAADVTPPHAGGKRWSSPHPMSRDDLVAELRRIGCHETDIGDALLDADRGWLAWSGLPADPSR